MGVRASNISALGVIVLAVDTNCGEAVALGRKIENLFSLVPSALELGGP